MYIKLNYINVFKKCIEKLQYMYIVRHMTTWDHWDLGPCAPILQYGPWAQPLHPKIEQDPILLCSAQNPFGTPL